MRKIKQMIAGVLPVILLAMPMTAMAESSENIVVQDHSLTIERTFTASSSDADFPDTYTYDGVEYTLKDVSTEILNTIIPETKTFTYLSPESNSEEELEEIPETMDEDGITYTLKSKELLSKHVEGRTEYKTREILFENIENNGSIPSYAEVTVNDDDGNEIFASIPLLDTKVEQEIWADTFSFPIRFSNYDADTFYLSGTEIPKDADLMEYADAFLSYLGLSKDYYKITSITWDGDEFEENGILCRNAVANGEKYVKDITGSYGGDVVVGEHDIYYYQCVYEKVAEENEYSYEIKATATYETEEVEEPVVEKEEEKGLIVRILDWIKENPVAAIGIGILAFALLIVLVLFILSRKKDDDNDRTEFVDIDKKK